MTSPATAPMRRARSDEAKADRRAAILAAARTAIRDEGFDGITMAGLARRAGIAKGTLYIYFETREEVFAALFVQLVEDWTGDVFARWDRLVLKTPRALVAEMSQAALATPQLLPLAARFSAILEARLPRDSFIAVKRRMWALIGAVAARIAGLLALEPEAASRATMGLMVAFQGAAQNAVIAERDGSDMPGDVQTILDQTRFGPSFEVTAEYVLAGAIAG